MFGFEYTMLVMRQVLKVVCLRCMDKMTNLVFRSFTPTLINDRILLQYFKELV
jgi:hypothetical protein